MDAKEKRIESEKGMASIEYAITVVVIACVAVLGIELLGTSVKGLLDIALKVLP